jgi:hypothetical protein
MAKARLALGLVVLIGACSGKGQGSGGGSGGAGTGGTVASGRAGTGGVVATGGAATGGSNGTGGAGTGGGAGIGGVGTVGAAGIGGVGTGGAAGMSGLAATGGMGTGGIKGTGGVGRGGAGGTGTMSGGATGTGGTTAGGGTGGGTGLPTGDIGTWTDAPGKCPTGTTQIDVTTVADLASAARGEDSHGSDPVGACYLIHDGSYVQSGTSPSLYIKVGGSDAAHRRIFVGQSRAGVIVKGRASIDSGVSHVQLSNLTFDISGYVQSGSFNTVTLLADSTDLRIDHVTFTGDCATGANGGHVEVDGSSDVVVESCLIEKFGRCGPNGHQDHGVYLGSGSNITIRNNEIRGNASRGIQLNTEGGDYGTLDNVTIAQNRVHDNGHADYEDGIVMNATGTGTISNVVIEHNLIYQNYYSGLRESGAVFKSVVVRYNTFFHNGAASTGASRSELNLDDVGSGAATTITGNIAVASGRVLNDCYDAQPRGYLLDDNVAQGTSPTGAAGNCISGSITADPAFVNAATADFHAGNPAVAKYGAYAP